MSDEEARHEVECPSCGATIRARMADAPESSLRAELAEAQAEIARLTEERDSLHGAAAEAIAERDSWHDSARGAVETAMTAQAELARQRLLVEAATALVPEWTALDYDVRCKVYGDRPKLVEAADALVAAAEEGNKT